MKAKISLNETLIEGKPFKRKSLVEGNDEIKQTKTEINLKRQLNSAMYDFDHNKNK